MSDVTSKITSSESAFFFKNYKQGFLSRDLAIDEEMKKKLRRQWEPLPTLIKEKEPLWYRVPYSSSTAKGKLWSSFIDSFFFICSACQAVAEDSYGRYLIPKCRWDVVWLCIHWMVRSLKTTPFLLYVLLMMFYLPASCCFLTQYQNSFPNY